MNPTENDYQRHPCPASDGSSEDKDSLYDGHIVLDDNKTLDTVTPTATVIASTASTTSSSVTPASKYSYVREHAKYMKKRILNVSILEKVKERLERYRLERQVLEIKIKECEEYIAESEKAIGERNSIVQSSEK